MLLDKGSLAVTHVSTSEEKRFDLKGILVTASETVATDGCCMAIVKHPGFDEADFPIVPGEPTTGGQRPKAEFPKAGIIIPKEAAEKAAKGIPGPKAANGIPILRTVRLTLEGETARMVSTDLSTATRTEAKIPETNFPDFKRVESSTRNEKPAVSFAFNFHLLEKLAKVARAVKEADGGRWSGEIIFDVKDENHAIAVRLPRWDDAQRFFGILMPLLHDSAWKAPQAETMEESEEPKAVSA